MYNLHRSFLHASLFPFSSIILLTTNPLGLIRRLFLPFSPFSWIINMPERMWTVEIIPFFSIKDLSLASAVASHFEAYWVIFKNAKVKYEISIYTFYRTIYFNFFRLPFGLFLIALFIFFPSIKRIVHFFLTLIFLLCHFLYMHLSF